MANSWTDYVKNYASKNKMTYSQALKDPLIKGAWSKEKETNPPPPKIKVKKPRGPTLAKSSDTVPKGKGIPDLQAEQVKETKKRGRPKKITEDA